MPPLLELAKRLEQQAKGMVVPATLFEKFGFNYIGPIDGHDLDSLIPTLENIKGLKGPQFLHVVTKKGQGYKLAEADPVAYHGPGKFDPSGRPGQARHASQADLHPGVRPMAVRHGCQGPAPGGHHARPCARARAWWSSTSAFPGRYYDVGIAEQHAVTFAAGMACEGVKPVVAIYSTFLQRAYDQLIHDVALQNLPVVFALDRAGLVGADGATHAGAYDIAFVRCIPNMSMACPADERECRQLLTTAYEQDHPVAVRYPRGSGAGVAPLAGLDGLPFGKGEVRRDSWPARSPSWLLARLLYPALQAAEALDATVVNMRWAKPLDDGAAAAAGRRARGAGHRGGGLHHGRCGQRRVRGPERRRLAARRVLQLGLPDRLHRAWRPRQAAGAAGAGCRRASSTPFASGFCPEAVLAPQGRANGCNALYCD